VAGHKLVRYADAFLRLPAFRWVEQFAQPGESAVRVDNIEMARSLVLSGAGIGVLYCVAGDGEPGLVRVFEKPIDQTRMNIVYHQSMRGSARVRAVLDMLIDYHVENRARLSGRRE
jgi:DNA-binding transcriptional LysR family regulator